jgi:hypothetical protein
LRGDENRPGIAFSGVCACACCNASRRHDRGVMINLCVIHNNEAPRLEYLRAQIGGLAKALETDGISLRLYDVGPEASGMAGQVPQDSFLNRLKRAWAAAWLFAGYARHDPRRRTDRLRYARLWFRHFKSILFDYRRSIRIEQEVLYAWTRLEDRVPNRSSDHRSGERRDFSGRGD